MKLQNITIADYINILKSKGDYREINDELVKSLGAFGGAVDLSLFLDQKDLVILLGKFYIAFCDRDSELMKKLERKMVVLQERVNSKQKKIHNVNPYESFLQSLQAVEKYFAFTIDKSNDMLYFSLATRQMLTFYEAQKRQVEENKNKK